MYFACLRTERGAHIHSRTWEVDIFGLDLPTFPEKKEKRENCVMSGLGGWKGLVAQYSGQELDKLDRIDIF